MVNRSDFPIFANAVFLNSCSRGALSKSVRGAYQKYLDDWETLGSPWELWCAHLETLRSEVADFINAKPHEIALVPSVSAALNALASALDFEGNKNRLLMTDYEFPTVGQIWHAQKNRGAEVSILNQCNPNSLKNEIGKSLDNRVRLISMTHVSYQTGARFDPGPVVEMAKASESLVLLDSFQAIGTFPIDVRSLGVDFMVGGFLKYLLGCPGIAFLYVREELLSELNPTQSGWFSQEDIHAMDHTRNKPAAGARKFEGGTPPVPNIYAARAGLALIREKGIENIQDEIQALTGRIKAMADDLGLALATPANAHGAMIALAARDENAIVQKLAEENVIVSNRGGNLRISPHFYNSAEDIEKLAEALEKNRDLMKSG